MSASSSSSWADFSSKIRASRKAKDKDSNIRDVSLKEVNRRHDAKLDEKKAEWDDLLGKRDKKLPAYLRPSPNVEKRSDKHDRRTTSSWARTPSSELEHVRASLERKARLYDQLQRGRTGGLSEERFRDSLIDWNRKGVEEADEGEESNNDRTDDRIEDDDEQMVEYEDEFGRHRRVKRSEVPRQALEAQRKREEDNHDHSLVTYGPATSFPVYKQDPNRRRDQSSTSAGYKRTAPDHFDGSSDKRYRGAGFYEFSQDDMKRAEQMASLRQARQETEHHRTQQSR